MTRRTAILGFVVWALAVPALVACRFGGPSGNPSAYVDIGDAADATGGGQGVETGVAPSDDSTTPVPPDDAPTAGPDDAGLDAAVDNASPPDSPGPPPGDSGCSPSTCPSAGCALGTAPCCNAINLCGCGYGDSAALCF